jgi:hypothetical protein
METENNFFIIYIINIIISIFIFGTNLSFNIINDFVFIYLLIGLAASILDVLLSTSIWILHNYHQIKYNILSRSAFFLSHFFKLLGLIFSISILAQSLNIFNEMIINIILTIINIIIIYEYMYELKKTDYL